MANQSASSQTRIVMATVKGDVHDIGKNIVGVVLGCNNYEVIDLGVMVPAERILTTARERGAAIIGLSGLITPSLDEMVHVAGEMQRQGFTVPLLIGGATTSAAHTAVKIAPQYGNPVVHVIDASRVVGVVAQLLNPQTRDEFARRVAAEPGRASPGLCPATEASPACRCARPAPTASRWTGQPRRWSAPRFSARGRIAPLSLEALTEYIDWSPFFHVWELRGRYPAILDDPRYGAEARRLFQDAQTLLRQIIEGRRLEARAVLGFFPANAAGDDVVLFTDDTAREERAVFHSLRQQTPRANGAANLALADFVAPRGLDRRDYVGGLCGHGRTRGGGASRGVPSPRGRLQRHHGRGASGPPGRGSRGVPAQAGSRLLGLWAR